MELQLQPRGTRGESGGQTGHTYDISNKHRLGYSEVELVQKMIDGVNKLWEEDKQLQAGKTVELYRAMPAQTNGPFPNIQSKHSLVASHVTEIVCDKLKGIETKTSGFTLIQAIACAVEFDNQHCGIYAGDWDSYKDFAPVFDPIIQEYHGISADSRHTSDMDASKIKGNIESDVPVHSARIRVGRSIDGFGLSPGITKDQRLGVESLMKSATSTFSGDLAGKYYPLTGMDEKIRQQLVDDHSCLFLVIEILLLLVWREIGLRDVESSTMMQRPSSFGSMKRINSESSPCRREVMSRVSLRDLQEESRLLVTLSRRNLERTSVLMPSMVTSTLAQQILVLE